MKEEALRGILFFVGAFAGIGIIYSIGRLVKFLASIVNEVHQDNNKTYTFSVTEMEYIGEKYEYLVEASSKDEALRKLVKWFYGKDKGIVKGVRSNRYDIVKPRMSTFKVENMPRWFAEMISGKQTEEHFKKLKKFSVLTGIELKDNEPS